VAQRHVVRADYMLAGMFALEHLATKRDVNSVLNAQELPTSICDQPSAIVLIKDLVAVYQNAARILGTGDLGTQIASLVGIQDYGLMCEYAIQGTNLADAFKRLLVMYPIEVCGVEASLSISGSEAVVKQRSEARRLVGWHHMSNAEACQYVNLIRLFAGTDWKPTRMTVDYPATLRSREFEEFVSCPIGYGAEAMTLTFPSHVLQLPSPRPLDARSVLTFGDVLRLDRPTIPLCPRDLVEALVHSRLLCGKTDRDGLAAKLGIGTRTMQRQLEAAGTSYFQLIDNVRRERAHGLLLETTLPIGEIADALDYRYPAHFSRAFKRWSGVSPMHYRKACPDGKM
jgi:AraC-like DNA-binding protein